MSTLLDQLELDDPIELTASSTFGPAERRTLDDQIRSAHRHVLQSLLLGIHCTWVTISGTTVVVGDIVSLDGGAAMSCTKMNAAPALVAGAAFGVVMIGAAAGAKALVARSGAISTSVTGLASGAPGHVRVNTSTGRCEKVASLASGDYPVGYVDNAGTLTLNPTFKGYGVPASGVSPGGWADDGGGGVNAYSPVGEDFTVRAGGAAGATQLVLSDSGTSFQVIVAAGVYLDADTVYMRSAGGVNRNSFSSTTVSLGVPAVTFGATVAAPTISQATRTTDAAPQDLSITAQSPYASATGANRKPGNVVCTVGSPTNGGTTHGKFSCVVGGSERMSCDNATFTLNVTTVSVTCSGWSIVQATANNLVMTKVFPKARATSAGTTVIASGTIRDTCLTRVDVTVTVIEEGATTHATWTLRSSFARNGAGPAAVKDGADSVLEAIGTNADAPPASWVCVLDDNGNNWEVQLTLPAVNAQASCSVQITEATNANTP